MLAGKYPDNPEKLAAIYITDAVLKVIQVGVTTKTIGVPKVGKGKPRKIKLPTGFNDDGFIKLDHSKLPEDYQILYGQMDEEPEVQKLIDTVKAEEAAFVPPQDPAQAAIPFSTEAEEHNKRLAAGEFDTDIEGVRSISDDLSGEQLDLFKDPITGDPFRKVPGRRFIPDVIEDDEPDFENMSPEEFDEWLSSQPRAKPEDFTESARSIDEMVDHIARINEEMFR